MSLKRDQIVSKSNLYPSFSLGACYYLSSTVNPFLYSLLSVRFRRGFKDVLRHCCGTQVINSQQGQTRPAFRSKHGRRIQSNGKGGKNVESSASLAVDSSSRPVKKYKLLYVSSLKCNNLKTFTEAEQYDLVRSCPPEIVEQNPQISLQPLTSSEDEVPRKPKKKRKSRKLKRCRGQETLEMNIFEKS